MQEFSISRAHVIARRANQVDLLTPAVQPLLQKYSASHLTQISSLSRAVPRPNEGRFAIVTDVGRGMRWTRAVPETKAPTRGRRSRVVLTPRRRRQVCEKKRR